MTQYRGIGPGQNTLIDILDKVLDKGLVVAGDIRISLANVELLTIKIRLMVCSIDKAQEIGLDWWRHDGFLSSEGRKETEALLARVEAMERLLTASTQPPAAPAKPVVRARRASATQRRPARGGSRGS